MPRCSTSWISNSLGGWIAAELALLDSPRVGSLILVDAVGIETGHLPRLETPEQLLPAIWDFADSKRGVRQTGA